MHDKNNLKSGNCPKCNSTEIYTTSGTTKRGERIIIPVTGSKFFLLEIYICTDCGHFEEFVPDKELEDKTFINKIKESWKKVIK